MADFFRFEFQMEPPSLADLGSLRTGKKSAIVECIKAPVGRAGSARLATVVLMDMAAVVHMVAYISKDICRLRHTTHRAILGISNNPNHGTSHHSRISVVVQVHGLGLGMATIKFQSTNGTVLKNEENKKELFAFLSEEIVKQDLGGKLLHVQNVREFFLTVHAMCLLSNHATTLKQIQGHFFILRMHQDRDTRQHNVRTVDSDIVVLAIGLFPTLGLVERWVGFGSGKKLRDIPIHDICSDLGPSRSVVLSLFHVITRCDTTSHFLGFGKKTAWSSWQNTPGLTETLLALACFSLGSLHMQKLERFVVIMYSKGCGLAKVNEARHRLVTSGKKYSCEHPTITSSSL